MIRQKNLWLRDITILLGLDFEFESVAQVFGLTRNWKNTYLNWSHWARVQTMLILWLDWGKRASLFIYLVVDSWQSIYREVYLRLLEFTNRIVGKLMSLIFESLYLDCFSKLAKGERLASMCLRNSSIFKIKFYKNILAEKSPLFVHKFHGHFFLTAIHICKSDRFLTWRHCYFREECLK